jgi:hypothetical protein
LRNTPLGLVRLFAYWESNKAGSSLHFPSIGYDSRLAEWITYELHSESRSILVPLQLLFQANGPIAIGSGPELDPDELLAQFRVRARDSGYAKDVRGRLPDDFTARLLQTERGLVFIARSATALAEAEGQLASDIWGKAENRERLRLEFTDHRQHFRWSKKNWLMFCGKTAFELLSLFEGQELCGRDCFATVRGTVCGPLSEDSREVIFDAHGPNTSADVPQIIHADLTVGQNSPMRMPAVLGRAEPGMHSVVVYEADGWVCASVSVAGWPPCVLVLAGPEVHLHDLYVFAYDDRLDEVGFLKLASDQTSPIIPFPISGDPFDCLTRTYRLRRLEDR